jgi:predicted dehydrogenase
VDKVRVGMIGAGRITDLHYPAYHDYPKAELVTVCANTPETAKRRAAEWNARKWTTDHRTILADPEIDMVEINTPHPLHHRMVLEAAAAGKHVQLQKPMAMTIAHCDEMIAACRKAGVKFKIIENFVFYPPYRKAKELIDAGEIGDLIAIRFKLGTGGSGGWWVPLPTWIWRLAETEKGGGPTVFDDGYHKFSLGLFFGGKVEKVFAWIDRSFGLIDSPAAITWRYASGAVGTFECTFSPNLHVKSKYYTADERVEITGTRGVIHVTRCTAQLFDEPALLLYRDGRRTAFEDLRTDWLDSFIDSTRHFIDCILEDREPLLTGEQAKAVQQFSFAAIRSAKEGREVAPNEVTE